MAGQNELRRDTYLDLLRTIAKEGESPQSQANILDALLTYFGPHLQTVKLIKVGDVECGLGYPGSGRHLSEDKPEFVGKLTKNTRGLFFYSPNSRNSLQIPTKTEDGLASFQIWGIAKSGKFPDTTTGEWALLTVDITVSYDRTKDRALFVSSPTGSTTSADLLRVTGLSVAEIFDEIADIVQEECEWCQSNLEMAQSLNAKMQGVDDLLRALNE